MEARVSARKKCLSNLWRPRCRPAIAHRPVRGRSKFKGAADSCATSTAPRRDRMWYWRGCAHPSGQGAAERVLGAIAPAPPRETRPRPRSVGRATDRRDRGTLRRPAKAIRHPSTRRAGKLAPAASCLSRCRSWDLVTGLVSIDRRRPSMGPKPRIESPERQASPEIVDNALYYTVFLRTFSVG